MEARAPQACQPMPWPIVTPQMPAAMIPDTGMQESADSSHVEAPLAAQQNETSEADQECKVLLVESSTVHSEATGSTEVSARMISDTGMQQSSDPSHVEAPVASKQNESSEVSTAMMPDTSMQQSADSSHVEADLAIEHDAISESKAPCADLNDVGEPTDRLLQSLAECTKTRTHEGPELSLEFKMMLQLVEFSAMQQKLLHQVNSRMESMQAELEQRMDNFHSELASARLYSVNHPIDDRINASAPSHQNDAQDILFEARSLVPQLDKMMPETPMHTENLNRQALGQASYTSMTSGTSKALNSFPKSVGLQQHLAEAELSTALLPVKEAAGAEVLSLQPQCIEEMTGFPMFILRRAVSDLEQYIQGATLKRPCAPSHLLARSFPGEQHLGPSEPFIRTFRSTVVCADLQVTEMLKLTIHLLDSFGDWEGHDHALLLSEVPSMTGLAQKLQGQVAQLQEWLCRIGTMLQQYVPDYMSSNAPIMVDDL